MRLKHAGNPWIHSYTGKRIHILRPKASELCIEDIAWSLSRQSRFYGHTRGDPYVTAQHCVLCSRHCAPGHEWAALMHDAGEGVLGDVSSKIKALLLDYLHIEGTIVEPVVMRRFKVSYPFAPEVHQIDKVMAVTEMRDLQGRNDWKDGPYKPLPIRIKPWPWRKAYREFLKRFHELKPRGVRA